MNVQQYPLKKGQYFPDLTAKKFVVWHGTAGRTLHTPVSGRPGKATTSIDGWNLNADRVGAPWLVDRDGTIYETFNDSAWIYHLGLKGTKGRYDKQSVAIEFANEGPLDLDGDRLYAFGMNTPNTVYNGPFIDVRLARLQLLRAARRGASRCRDRAHARHLPAPQDRARLLLPVHHVRLPALLPGRDDHLSLQLPRRQDRPLSAAVGVREDRSGGDPHSPRDGARTMDDILWLLQLATPRPRGCTPPLRQQEGPRASSPRDRSHQRTASTCLST